MVELLLRSSEAVCWEGVDGGENPYPGIVANAGQTLGHGSAQANANVVLQLFVKLQVGVDTSRLRNLDLSLNLTL